MQMKEIGQAPSGHHQIRMCNLVVPTSKVLVMKKKMPYQCLLSIINYVHMTLLHS